MDEQRHEYLKVPEVLRIARSRAYELVGSGEIRRSPVSSVGTAANSDYGKGMRPPR